MLADLGCVGHVLLERLAQLRRLQPYMVDAATAPLPRALSYHLLVTTNFIKTGWHLEQRLC